MTVEVLLDKECLTMITSNARVVLLASHKFLFNIRKSWVFQMENPSIQDLTKTKPNIGEKLWKNVKK
jgi:hypothetical protein